MCNPASRADSNCHGPVLCSGSPVSSPNHNRNYGRRPDWAAHRPSVHTFSSHQSPSQRSSVPSPVNVRGSQQRKPSGRSPALRVRPILRCGIRQQRHAGTCRSIRTWALLGTQSDRRDTRDSGPGKRPHLPRPKGLVYGVARPRALTSSLSCRNAEMAKVRWSFSAGHTFRSSALTQPSRKDEAREEQSR